MNAFEALADAQIVSPVRTRRRAAEARSRHKTEAEKKLDEKDILLRLYKAGRRAEVRALMTGPHGKEVRGLVSFMRAMSLSSASALVRVVEGANWIKHLSEGERALIESLVFNGIARLREKNGLSFWEDPLPGEPPKAFDDILAILRSAP